MMSCDPSREARARWAMCERIASVAQSHGLAATPAKVNRQYRIWVQWYEGRLATGYLIRQTGVKPLQERC